MDKTIIILMSPAGGAKHIIADYIVRTKNNAIEINRKHLEKMRGHFHNLGTYHSMKMFYKEINQALKNYSYVVINDYNITLDERQSLFENINYKDCRVIGIWIEVPIKQAHEYNKKKSLFNRVNDNIINLGYQYAVSPEQNEPFDDIIYISKNGITSGIGICRDFPKIGDMYEILDQI